MASQLSVFVRRRFRASREAIFRAFTEPDTLVRWFSPSVDIGTEVLEHDLRVGGRYRFGFRFPDGRLETVVGSFKEVEPPGRLVFTWTWEPPDPHAGIDTLVSIVISEMEGESEVVVTHDRFPSHETRERHELGWGATLDRLEKLLEKRT